MYSPTLSLSSALDGGGWSAPRLGRSSRGNDRPARSEALY
jgi:hypothetical protein